MAGIAHELARLSSDQGKFMEIGQQLREEAIQQRRIANQHTIALQELLRQAADAPRLQQMRDAEADNRLAVVLTHAAKIADEKVEKATEQAIGHLARVRSEVEVQRRKD